VPNEVIIQWLNESPLSNEEMDELVGMLEKLEEFRIIAGLIADEIESPTLENDIARNQPWYNNDKCNTADHQKPRKEWDKKWLQRFKRLYPESLIWAKPTTWQWHNDL